MDWYRRLLASAHWDWLEYKFSRWHQDKRLTKRRPEGRAAKRKARAIAKKEIDNE